MSSAEKPSRPPADANEPPIREHVFDGIQEYDNRLPNWWLYTLYGSIAFWLIYWFVHMNTTVVTTDGRQVDHAMKAIAAVKLASSIDVNNDALFWEMSQNPAFVNGGKQTYASLCAACHLGTLKGKAENSAAVGPNLIDTAWIHGGTPKEVFQTVAHGVQAKGMPAWEPVLGQKKTAEVVAYLLSHHTPGEPITVEVSK